MDGLFQKRKKFKNKKLENLKSNKIPSMATFEASGYKIMPFSFQPYLLFEKCFILLATYSSFLWQKINRLSKQN